MLPCLENTFCTEEWLSSLQTPAAAEAASLDTSASALLHSNEAVIHSFLSLEEMAQLAWHIHFLVRKVSVTLTISGDLQQAHCVSGWILMIKKYFWYLMVL